jgi:hypothetical protein
MQTRGPVPEAVVPLADADIATKIARAARRGRGTDRTPTLEQLLSAFGESEPTPEARRRAEAALDLAGVEIRPSIMDVAPGERLLLTAPGGNARRGGGRALGGLLALGAIIASAAVAATLAGRGGDDRAADDLPPDTAPAAALATRAETTATETARTTATSTAAETTTEPAATTTAPAAAPRKPRPATVTVRVSALTRPTFLCVEDGAGNQLFGGTLSGTQTFKAKLLRLNIGLASTAVSVNGRPVPLGGSPAGLEISRKGGTRTLPLGRRPCG